MTSKVCSYLKLCRINNGNERRKLFFRFFFVILKIKKCGTLKKRLAYLLCFYLFYLLVSQLLLQADAIPSRSFFRLTALYYQLWISTTFNEFRIDQQSPILTLLYIIVSISLSFVVLQIPRLLTLIWYFKPNYPLWPKSLGLISTCVVIDNKNHFDLCVTIFYQCLHLTKQAVTKVNLCNLYTMSHIHYFEH